MYLNSEVSRSGAAGRGAPGLGVRAVIYRVRVVNAACVPGLYQAVKNTEQSSVALKHSGLYWKISPALFNIGAASHVAERKELRRNAEKTGFSRREGGEAGSHKEKDYFRKIYRPLGEGWGLVLLGRLPH